MTTDAGKALAAFESTLKMTCFKEAQVNALPRFKGKGRPAQGRKPDFYVYRIEGTLASLPEERTRRLVCPSCFILATNQLDCTELSDEDLIAAFNPNQKSNVAFDFSKTRCSWLQRCF